MAFMMKLQAKQIFPVVLTLVAVSAALVVVHHLWEYYINSPWTRDGHVRADVWQVSPDVGGLVTDVRVKDNQPIKRGDVLFVVDHARYQLAAEQATANLAAQKASLAQARREATRSRGLSDLVAKESLEEADAKVQQLQAAVDGAESALRLAKLNLERTEVRSPVDGYLNDRAPHQGDYVHSGQPVLSVVDANSVYVDGYFEETKLERVQPNQPVLVRIMGAPRDLKGHVQSIAAGIEDRDRSNGSNLLPNVNPTFNWVRLAQRIPVRIVLDEKPSDIRLIAGRTATVSVVEQQGGASKQGGQK